MPSLEFGTLNCFYFFLLMLGVGYALMLMILGGLHSIHLPFDIDLSGLHLPGDAHVDVGAPSHEVSITSLSPISIAAFVTSFGGIGLIMTQGFHASGGVSLAWATIGSLVIALISHFVFFYVFIAPQASSALTTSGVLGLTAEVTVPIQGDSIGEVAYVAMGERHTAPARSAGGTFIPRGQLVTIERLAGTVILVRPLNASSVEPEKKTG